MHPRGAGAGRQGRGAAGSRVLSEVDVSVVVPTLNGGERLAELLRRVEAQRTELRTERLLVDSGSSDGVPELAERQGWRVLRRPRAEFNHGATRDLAIAQTKGRALALLVQDALPRDEHWLDHLVQPLLADPQAAGAFARQVPIPGGNPILDARLAGWVAGLPHSRRRQLADPGDWEKLDPFQRLDHVAFDNVSSCVSRRHWKERPFGRRDFGEDIGWATWAIRAGYAILFCGDAVVEHSHDRSAWYEARRIYCDHRNLNALLGLRTISSFAQVRAARRASLAHYEALLAAAPIDEEERERRRRWARRYAIGEALAQWLAPKVNASGARGFLGVLDRRIRRGI